MSLNRLMRAVKNKMLVSPRHELYLSRTGEVELSETVSKFILTQLQAKQRDRTRTFTGSSRGSCPRAQVFAYLSFPQQRVVSSDTNGIFVHGTWTHLKWQAMGFDAGWLAQAEVSISMPELRFTGTIDGVLDTGEGWELKSINSRGYRYMLQNGPLPKHVQQIHSYMLATGIVVWSLVYENKDTQEWKEWVIHRDERVVDQVFTELQQVNQAIDHSRFPQPLDDCIPKPEPKCQYAAICHQASWPRKVMIRRG